MAEKEKIIQIIPAPKGLEACMVHYTFNPDSDTLEPLFDELGRSVDDLYDVVCLALVENEKAERSVVPMICVNEDFSIWSMDNEYGNILLTSDLVPDYKGCVEKTACKFVEIGLQYDMGTIRVKETASHFIDLDENDDFRFNFFLDDGQIFTVGKYKSEDMVRCVLNDFDCFIANKCEFYESNFYNVPSEDEAAELLEKERMRESERAFSMFFKSDLSKWLVKVGYRKISEVKALTDDDLNEKHISKQNLQSFHTGLKKMSKR